MKRRTFLQRLLFIGAGFPYVLRVGRAWGETRPAAPSHDWESVEFSFDANGQSYPGIAIKLPDTVVGDGKLYVACKICPHQGCEFGYERNFELVGDIVGKTFVNPVLFCRCHMSVYDPLRNGKVLNGPAPRPPWLFTYARDGQALKIQSVEDGVGHFG